MNGLPESGFTIDYACFLNQDSGIIIGRHKEYIDSIPTRYSNSIEIYLTQNKGAKCLLKSEIPFDDIIHIGNKIKNDSCLFVSLFSQNEDAYILQITHNPEYSAKLVSTGKTRYSPIEFKYNLLYSSAYSKGEHSLITMDSTFHVLNCILSPPLSHGLFEEDYLIAIRRYVRNKNLFVLDKSGQWNIYTCPSEPSFIAKLKNGICIAGYNKSNGIELYSYTQPSYNPQLIYSSDYYTFVKDLITDKSNTIILVLGYQAGIFMAYKLVVSNNLGQDWKTFDIPNSMLYSACTLHGDNVYIFLTNAQLIQYNIANPLTPDN